MREGEGNVPEEELNKDRDKVDKGVRSSEQLADELRNHGFGISFKEGISDERKHELLEGALKVADKNWQKKDVQDEVDKSVFWDASRTEFGQMFGDDLTLTTRPPRARGGGKPGYKPPSVGKHGPSGEKESLWKRLTK